MIQKSQKKILKYFRNFEFYTFILFIFSIIIVNFIDHLLINSFTVILFFFIPGYLLLNCFIKKRNINYHPIETIIISFGLSLFLILVLMYLLINYNLLDSILFVYFFLTSIFFIIIIFRKIRSNHSEFSQEFSFSILHLRKDRYLTTVIFFTILFFLSGFFIRQYLVVRFPDEYYYLWISNIKILPNVSYRTYQLIDFDLIISSHRKMGFIFTLSFYFNLVGSSSGVSANILMLLFYSMLVPVTFLIGSLHNKKTGIIAAIFMACNPIIWFWNISVMPDILYTVLAGTCFYFFYKSFKEQGNIKWQYLVPAIIFFVLSYTQQPKLIFVWVVPFLIYFLSARKRYGKNNRNFIILIIAVVVLLIIFLLIIIILEPWFFQYDLPDMLEALFSIFYFNLQEWIEFFSPGGTVWFNFSYPYYYSYAIIILALVGIFCFMSKHTIRENILVFFSIGITLFFHSTVFSAWGARFSFLIFPLIMVLSAIGLKTNIGKFSIYLIPLLIFLFFLLFVNEPGNGQFPQVMVSYGIISKLVAIVVILHKILEGFRSNLQRLSWKKFNPVKLNQFMSIILIFLVASSSLSIGYSIVTNNQYLRNDYITPEDVGLPQAGNWLIANAPANSVIITNTRAHILSYYTDCNFDIEDQNLIINREGVGTIITPNSETQFLELLDSTEFNYLVVFSNNMIGENWKRPYFYPYVVKNTLFTIYRPLKKTTKLNISESVSDWIKTFGDVNFSLDSTDKINGNSSIKVDGITDEKGKTVIYNKGSWNLSNTNYLDFWFKLDNATNPTHFSIYLTDINGNNVYWINNTQIFNNWTSNNWENLQINLKEYKVYREGFNTENVKKVQIYVYAKPNTPITYHLDFFQVHSMLEEIYCLT